MRYKHIVNKPVCFANGNVVQIGRWCNRSKEMGDAVAMHDIAVILIL